MLGQIVFGGSHFYKHESLALALLEIIPEFHFNALLEILGDLATPATLADPRRLAWLAPKIRRDAASNINAQFVRVATPTIKVDFDPAVRIHHIASFTNSVAGPSDIDSPLRHVLEEI